MQDEMQDMRDAVVVGYDGSEAGAAAIDWAATEAVWRAARLVVLYATDVTAVLVGPENVSSWLAVHADAVGRRVVADGVARARKVTDDVVAVSEVGGAAGALTRASETADLVVVGASGVGQVAGILFGSVALAVTAHAACPVVVVRGDAVHHPGPDWPVTVAVDGSLEADAAVDYGASLAASTGAELRLVSVWELHAGEAWSTAYWADADRGPYDVARSLAESLLTQTRERVARSHPDVRVQTHAVQGVPGVVLTEASRGSALLVMGSRGRGGLKGLLLGSVSRAMTHLAPCPVMVLR